LKVIVLGSGTSQGVPIISCKCKVCTSENQRDKRLRASVLIELQNKTIVIDAGPDFRQQMLRENVNNIDAILITHEHRDHISGLDDIRPYNFLNRKSIDIYAEERVQNAIKSEFHYSFGDKKYPGVPKINLNNINSNEKFYIGNIQIIPIRAYHYKLPVLGYRIENFTYLTDINYIPEEEKVKISGSKYIIIDALRKTKNISHYSVHEALEVIKEFSPKRAYLTHISHQMGLHDEVNKELPQNVSLAYDGLKIDC